MTGMYQHRASLLTWMVLLQVPSTKPSSVVHALKSLFTSIPGPGWDASFNSRKCLNMESFIHFPALLQAPDVPQGTEL